VRVVILVCAVMLAVALVLVLRRVEAGPSVLDRVVGLDVLVSTLLAGFVLYAAWTRRTDFLAVMVVLSLVGFVGAVTIARFVAAESEEEARILTPEEVADLRERERAVIDALEGGAPIPGEAEARDATSRHDEADRRDGAGGAR
jgi:multicomponent Na+:H+ antiporter subunit F